MNGLFRVFAMAVAVIFLAVGARADESGGAVLTIAGQEHAFTLNSMQSDWRGSSSYASVNISVKATDKETRGKFPALVLGFEIHSGQVRKPEARLIRLTGGSMERLYGEPKAGGLVLKVKSVKIEGDLLTVSGSFSSDLGTSKNFGRDIDLSDPLPVSGNFSVILKSL